MQTTDANLPVSERRECPLCGGAIDPAHPNECTKCDWIERPPEPEVHGSVRDRAAVVLSLVPGLGHFYKGHKGLAVLFLVGAGLAFFAAVVMATATAGFALLLLPLYWAGVMLHVYGLEDRASAPLPKP